MAKESLGDEAARDNWLPEDFVLRLTALEAGALLGILSTARVGIESLRNFEVNVKGREAPMPMIDRLIEKVQEAWLRR